MLTWEGSWPNSLVRRPPWLHACSVKNKQKTNIFVKKNIIVNFIIQKLKSKYTSLQKYTNWAKLINPAYTYKFQLKTTINRWTRPVSCYVLIHFHVIHQPNWMRHNAHHSPCTSITVAVFVWFWSKLMRPYFIMNN